MNTANDEVEALLATWLDDGNAEALGKACELAKTRPINVDALLTWTRNYGAEPPRTELANRRLRFAIGLPVIPGPACRPTP